MTSRVDPVCFLRLSSLLAINGVLGMAIVLVLLWPDHASPRAPEINLPPPTRPAPPSIGRWEGARLFAPRPERPPPASSFLTAPLPPATPEPLRLAARLAGVLIDEAGQALAILEPLERRGQFERLALGDRFEGWRLTAIDRTGVEFEKGPDRRRIELDPAFGPK
jgi:hypothetical protein